MSKPIDTRICEYAYAFSVRVEHNQQIEDYFLTVIKVNCERKDVNKEFIDIKEYDYPVQLKTSLKSSASDIAKFVADNYLLAIKKAKEEFSGFIG